MSRSARPVLVVAALREEGRAVWNRLEGRRRLAQMESGRRSLRCWGGTIGPVPVVLGMTGDGEENARRGIRAILEHSSPRLVIVTGVAGGLDPSLAALDLVLAGSVVREGGPRFESDPAWTAYAARFADATPGTLITVERLACTRAEKVAALERLTSRGLSPEGALVDMETGWYVERAQAEELPWLVLRTVSDPAEDDLPAFLEDCRNPRGAVNRKEVALKMMQHPGSVPALLRLAHRVRAGSTILAEALERIITELPLAAPTSPEEAA